MYSRYDAGVGCRSVAKRRDVAQQPKSNLNLTQSGNVVLNNTTRML